MKIGTYNINGINGRLPNLLRWLAETKPDVVCLQELKAPDERFPEEALIGLGYYAIWQGQISWNVVAILSRYAEIQETRRGLYGETDDTHSRYIEAFINGVVIGCFTCLTVTLFRGRNLITNSTGLNGSLTMQKSFKALIFR